MSEIVLAQIIGFYIVCGVVVHIFLSLIFSRKEFIAYLKDEWSTTPCGKIDYKVDFWGIPIKYRPNPKALDQSMKRQHKAYTKAKADNPEILP